MAYHVGQGFVWFVRWGLETMPAKSKEQFRFMQAMLHGDKPKSGGKAPSKKVAEEFTKGVSYKALPERKSSGKVKPRS